MDHKADIVIAGGGAIGAATAYFLTCEMPGARILVICLLYTSDAADE